MASFFFWIIAVVVSFLIGGVFVFVLLALFGSIRDSFLTRGIPRNRKKFTEYIKEPENKEKFKDPGKTLDSEKEVKKEDERKRATKYREFERLRRDELKTRVGGGQTNNTSPPGDQQLQQQSKLLPNEPSREPKTNSSGNTKSKPRISLYD